MVYLYLKNYTAEQIVLSELSDVLIRKTNQHCCFLKRLAVPCLRARWHRMFSFDRIFAFVVVVF